MDVTSPGPRAIAVGGDVTGSVFVTGDVVVTNPYPALNDYYLDFRDDLARARGFVGRGRVFDYLADVEHSRTSGYIRIIADVGLGKSALAAEAARRFAAPSFFTNASRGLARPDQLLNHLSAVLIARFDLPHDHLPNRAGEDSSFLSLLLSEVAEKATDPVWLIVDALDEADESVAGRNTLLLPTHLPPRVYFLLTQRSGDYPLVTDPSTRVWDYPISWDSPMHQSDVETYLRRQAERPEIARVYETARPPVDPQAFVSRLKQASQGNFMYLSYLFADMTAGAPDLIPLDLEAIPEGLEGYYGQMWKRMEAIAKAEGREGTALYRPVAGLLAVAQEPVTVRWLADLSGSDPEDIRDQVLIPWRRFLTAELGHGSERWRIVHRSFGDFLSRKLDAPRIHSRVASYYCERPEQWAIHDGYATRNLSTHLRLAGNLAELSDLVTNRNWYEHQLTADPSGAGYLIDLSQAWAAASSADTEAVSRSGPAPFLAREVYYALASASMHSLSRSISSSLLATLFKAGILSAPQAIAIASQNPHAGAKSRDLAVITPLLPETMMPQVLAAARSIDESGPRVDALVAVATRLTEKEKADILGEALIVARSIEDGDVKVDAFITVGSELSADDRELLQDEAILAARSLDRDSQATQLAALAVEMDEPKRTSLLEEALAAARSNKDVEQRAETLTDLLTDLDLQEDETQKVVAEALAAVRAITAPDEQAPALISLLSHIREADRPTLVDQALAVGRSVTDPQARADALGALLTDLPETLMPIVLDETLAAVHAIPDEEIKMRQLFELVGQVPASAQSSLLEEALALARNAPTAEVRATRLTLLATQLAEPESHPVWDEALAAARQIEDAQAKAGTLVQIAMALPEDQAGPPLQEAFRIPAAMQAVGAVEDNEVEWIETLVAVVAKLGRSERRDALLSDAVTTARNIDPSYDRAHALVVLAPSLAGSGKDQVVQQILDTARTIDGYRERANVLTALIPMLDPVRRTEATREALAVILENDWTQFSYMMTVTDDLVVEFDRMAYNRGGQAAALLDLALAVDEPERTALLHEACDAVYHLPSGQQDAAIVSLAPYLAEEKVRKVLADIRSMQTDPWREQAVSMLLLSLAETASPEVALNEAQAIYGQAIPEALSAALAMETPRQGTGQSQEASSSQTDKGGEQDRTEPAHFVGSQPSSGNDDDVGEDESNDGEAAQIVSVTATGILKISDIYQLGDFATFTLDPDDFEEPQRQQILDDIFPSFLEARTRDLSTERLRRGASF